MSGLISTPQEWSQNKQALSGNSMRPQHLYKRVFNSVTDQLTDQQMDRRMDTPSYSDARMHLKIAPMRLLNFNGGLLSVFHVLFGMKGGRGWHANGHNIF